MRFPAALDTQCSEGIKVTITIGRMRQLAINWRWSRSYGCYTALRARSRPRCPG